MSLRRGLLRSELPTRAPEGFTDEVRFLSKDDRLRLTAFKSISRRAIEEARWLTTRTDSATAAAPYSVCVGEISDAMYAHVPAETDTQRDLQAMVLDAELEKVLEKIVQGSMELPDELAEDQIEDWIIYQALGKLYA